ncbi:MAG: family 16 glycoside hydrolase [Planctomycetota bacterium]|nr:family 16 glycoside hydrolase [Planctomycetota bacterium]
MKVHFSLPLCTLLVILVSSFGVAQPPQPDLGWVALFDGKSLTGWQGNFDLWRVEDGVIIGEGPEAGPIPRNDYLWHASTWGNFVLEAQFRIEGGNSGLQYRSRRADDGEAVGYQCDLDAENRYTGMLYESRGRGIAVPRGEMAALAKDGSRQGIGFLPDAEKTVQRLGDGQWHQMRIVAHGTSVRHEIDSVPVCSFIDGAPDAVREGKIGLQIHAGGPMRIEWKSIRIRNWQPLDGDPLEDCARVTGRPPENQPHWIWAPGPTPADQQVELIRTFTVDPQQPAVEASLTMSGDNHFVAYLDDQEILRGDSWEKPSRTIIKKLSGRHRLRVLCRNDAGPAGLAGILAWQDASGEAVTIVTDERWRLLADSTEQPVMVKGPVAASTAPWGDIGLTPGGSVTRWNLPAGFEAEILHQVDPEDGSWVCIALEAPGRFITSPQRGVLKRVVIGDDGVTVSDCANFGDAQGLLLVDGDLWVHVAGHRKDRGGLWILSDPDGDGFFDQEKRLSAMGPGGEHGVHALVRGPDGHVWTVVGNHITVPQEILTRDRYRDWQEDLIVPRLWDPNGHAVGYMAPAGQILRIDPKTLEWERVAGGLRNSYDLAFHHDGSLFTYDADMEWDIGTPWYRSPRVIEVVSGGEAGWRGGDGKWPDGIPDAVMPSVETDLSSPTGVSSGLEGTFPGRWRHAIYIADWAYGRILAYFPREYGAGWRGWSESFVSAAAFNVADMVFGADGALYGVTGGRGTRSTLFRIRADADSRPELAAPTTSLGQKVRALKRQLESGHLSPQPQQLGLFWRHLGHPDPAISYAARVALEQIPVAQWRDLVLGETGNNSRIGLLALARVGEAVDRDPLLEKLCDLPLAANRRHLLEELRITTVAIARRGDPAGATRQRLLARFDHQFPVADLAINRLCGDLLARLSAPLMTERIVPWLLAEAAQPEGLAALRLLRFSSRDDRQNQQVAEALKILRERQGGHSLRGFVDQIARELDDGSGLLIAPVSDPPVMPEPVTRWNEKSLLAAVSTGSGDRERGKTAYEKALCARCHRFGDLGGGSGPDLTGVRSRFSDLDLVRSLLEPSRDISDQYQWNIVTTQDDVAVGRILRKGRDGLILNTDPFGYQPFRIDGEVSSIEASPISPMPPGLLDGLDEGQVRDLWAFLGNSSRSSRE